MTDKTLNLPPKSHNARRAVSPVKGLYSSMYQTISQIDCNKFI